LGRVIVSFEDTTVRVVYAAYKGKGPVVKDALTLRTEQFDDFLDKEKTKEFIVVNNFKDSFQDIILIPPAKKRYLKKLIEAEVRKRATFQEFSFIYTVSGERLIENRKMKEVFVFAVNNEDIRGIINRFVNKGKIVRAIYPDVFAIASTISSAEPVLCVSEAGMNKNFFLIKDGKIQFVRTAQSLEKGINDLDVQNINMTINYCRQSMRINPGLIMLTGSLCAEYKATTPPSIPISCLSQHGPQKIFDFSGYTQQSQTFLDFAAAMSALYVSRDKDLLTTEYKNLYRMGFFLRYSTSLFLALSILCLGYAGYIIMGINDARDKINQKRRNLPDLNHILSTYDAKRAELLAYMPFIMSLKDTSNTPDIQRLLSLLSELKRDNISIDSAAVTAQGDIMKIEIKGRVKTEGFAAAQMYYQRMIDSITLLRGLTVKGHGLELKDRSFHIEMEYKEVNTPHLENRGQS